jgi:hypothetical protein
MDDNKSSGCSDHTSPTWSARLSNPKSVHCWAGGAAFSSYVGWPSPERGFGGVEGEVVMGEHWLWLMAKGELRRGKRHEWDLAAIDDSGFWEPRGTEERKWMGRREWVCWVG